MRGAKAIRGFTLVELLVALFITAIMFAIGYRALEQAFQNRRELDEQSARLIAVQQALRVLEQDFELLQPRPVRNLLGDGYLPAVTTQNNGVSSASGSLGSTNLNGGSLPLVTFTRGGWTNPAGIQRSELQRVSYAVENNALMREYTPVLDATAAVMPVKRQLIDKVKRFSLRFMNAGHQWTTDWPAITLGADPQGQTLRSRPVAVEVTLELEDWGMLVRIIEVAG